MERIFLNTIIIALSCALVSGTMLMGMQQQLKGHKTSETLPGMLFTGKISLRKGVQLYAGRSAEIYIRRTLVDSAGEAPTIHLNDVLIPIEAQLSWNEILDVKQKDFPAVFEKYKACEKGLPHNLLLRWLYGRKPGDSVILFIKNNDGAICKVVLECDKTFEHLESLAKKFIAWPNFVSNDVIDLLSAGIIVNNPYYRGVCFAIPKYLHGPRGFKLSDYQQTPQVEEKIRDEEKEVAPQPSVEDALANKKEVASYRQLHQYTRLHWMLAKFVLCVAVVGVANFIVDMIQDVGSESGNR